MVWANKVCGGHALRIAVGITALVVLMAGGAGAAITQINSCHDISLPGECAANQSIFIVGTPSNPNIISLLPFNATVNNLAGEMRTFIIVADQIVNVSWQINGTEVFNASGVTTSSYINSAALGRWNVTAVVQNANGTAMTIWDWIVSPLPIVRVDISNFAFNPSNITILKGTTVIWTNDDPVAHTVTSDTNIFDSGILNPGQTFQWTFNENGTFNYHCSIHPFIQGVVIVISTPPPPPPPMEKTEIGLQLIAENLTAPIGLVSPEDGSGRLFIVDQTGVINILTADGQILQEPFLNLSSSKVNLSTRYDERGLLGLAFHPNFTQNGRFFVYYSVPLRPGAPAGWSHTNRISEFRVLPDNPNKADPNSEIILLQVDKPQSNHNAGQIAFGPDGYLYIPIGDGGGANDVGIGHPPPGNGQNISTMLGKILRIDVDNTSNGKPYGIPPDNPFVGNGGLDEIFAFGLRNPFRIAFDAGGNHSLFVSDAGQNFWEEVDIVTKGGNYGWNINEGAHCFDPNNPNLSHENCPNISASGQPLTDPIIEYANAGQPGGIGIVVIGGFVYRGKALPEFNGTYIFGDFSKGFSAGNGSLFVARPPSSGEKMWSMKELRIATSANGRVGAFVRSFGQDTDHELYVLTSQMLGPTGNTGKIFKINHTLELTITASRANLTGAVVPTKNMTTNLNTSVTFTVTDGTNSVSGAVVTVTQGGSTLGSNTTDATGQATIIVKAPTNATVTATGSKGGYIDGTKVLVAKGDVNGDGQVNIVDALLIAQSTVGLRIVDPVVADVNGDGTVNIVDALFIAQYTVGLRTDPTTP
jgi:glucose/arabinose dehydrogenase/plastocyanin